jgi:hypothetical protein
MLHMCLCRGSRLAMRLGLAAMVGHRDAGLSRGFSYLLRLVE